MLHAQQETGRSHTIQVALHLLPEADINARLAMDDKLERRCNVYIMLPGLRQVLPQYFQHDIEVRLII